MKRYCVLYNTTGQYIQARCYKQKLFSGGSPEVLHFWNTFWESLNPMTKLVSFPSYEMALKWLLVQSNIPGIKEKIMFATLQELEQVPKFRYYYKRDGKKSSQKLYGAKLSEFEIVERDFTDEEFSDEYEV